MAQRGAPNRTQNEDENEYVEMNTYGNLPAAIPPMNDVVTEQETADGIYYGMPGTSAAIPPTSDAVVEQEMAGGIYDMPGTSDVYNIQGRGMSRQAQPVKKSEKSGGWTMVKKFQITIALMILVISTSAFAITWFSMLTGNVHSMIHRVQE